MSWNDNERILDIGSGSGDVTVTLISQVTARRATRHLVRGGLGGIISREKFFGPPLNIFRGGQEKCVLYLNNKKLTLPTGYSVNTSDLK